MAKKENEETPSESTAKKDQSQSTEEVHVNDQPQESAAQSTDENDAEKKIAELNDKYLRLYSDFDNFRKRTIKEKAEIINNASADLLKDLLVVLDDFERATANNENVEDPAMLKEGFKLIHHKLTLILQQNGLQAVESKGEVFDGDKHEAITNIAVADEAQKGKVIDVVERGYNLRGKTLRFAKVIVGQ